MRVALRCVVVRSDAPLRGVCCRDVKRRDVARCVVIWRCGVVAWCDAVWCGVAWCVALRCVVVCCVVLECVGLRRCVAVCCVVVWCGVARRVAMARGVELRVGLCLVCCSVLWHVALLCVVVALWRSVPCSGAQRCVVWRRGDVVVRGACVVVACVVSLRGALRGVVLCCVVLWSGVARGVVWWRVALW